MTITKSASHPPGSAAMRLGLAARTNYVAFERPILGGLALATFLLLWEGLVRGWWAHLMQSFIGGVADALRVKPIFLASPSTIAATAYDMLFVTGDLWPHLGLSAFEFVSAFAIAIMLGIPFGLVAGRYQYLSYAVEPLLAALNATPQVALLPLIVLWMGSGMPARIFIITLLMIVPILINAHAAVRTIDAKLLRLARSFSASEIQVFRSIILPAAFPYLLAGVRLAIGRGMIGIVVGEVFGSAVGLGVMINHAGSTFKTDRVFVGVVTIVSASLLLSELVRWIERRIEVWRQSAVEVE